MNEHVRFLIALLVLFGVVVAIGVVKGVLGLGFATGYNLLVLAVGPVAYYLAYYDGYERVASISTSLLPEKYVDTPETHNQSTGFEGTGFVPASPEGNTDTIESIDTNSGPLAVHFPIEWEISSPDSDPKQIHVSVIRRSNGKARIIRQQTYRIHDLQAQRRTTFDVGGTELSEDGSAIWIRIKDGRESQYLDPEPENAVPSASVRLDDSDDRCGPPPEIAAEVIEAETRRTRYEKHSPTEKKRSTWQGPLSIYTRIEAAAIGAFFGVGAGFTPDPPVAFAAVGGVGSGLNLAAGDRLRDIRAEPAIFLIAVTVGFVLALIVRAILGGPFALG